jgi:hypothetical protein
VVRALHGHALRVARHAVAAKVGGDVLSVVVLAVLRETGALDVAVRAALDAPRAPAGTVVGPAEEVGADRGQNKGDRHQDGGDGMPTTAVAHCALRGPERGRGREMRLLLFLCFPFSETQLSSARRSVGNSVTYQIRVQFPLFSIELCSSSGSILLTDVPL